MHDILPEEYYFYQDFFDKAEDIAKYYGFQPIQTPHLEKIELFTATLGETTDIVEKQMYTLKTRGGDRLVLRPEGTAPIMRAYLKYGMHTRPQPVMLWYKGSFFRHENPQLGRFREFQQFGLESIGEADGIADATIIKVALAILEEVGLKQITVHINSIGDKECKNTYRKELANYYRKKINQLCPDCRRRLKENPLRLLDCKEEKCQELKKNAPQMINFLCPNCKQHLRDVLETLDALNVPYLLDNYLVRGLDYYSRTVFEFFVDSPRPEPKPEEETAEKTDASIPVPAKSPSQLSGLAIAGGGRYDYLAKALGNKEVPGVGVAISANRVILALNERKLLHQYRKNPKIFFIQIGPSAKKESLLIMEMFRKANLPVVQSITKDSLKSQLKIATKLQTPYILLLGQKEAMENSIIVRDTNSGNQETVSFSEIIEFMKNKLRSKQ